MNKHQHHHESYFPNESADLRMQASNISACRGRSEIYSWFLLLCLRFSVVLDCIIEQATDNDVYITRREERTGKLSPVITHTPIFRWINIIAVATRNNLISDMNRARLYAHFGRCIDGDRHCRAQYRTIYLSLLDESLFCLLFCTQTWVPAMTRRI